MSEDSRCHYTIERRAKRLRYVLGRARCKNRPVKGKDYCWLHGGRNEKYVARMQQAETEVARLREIINTGECPRCDYPYRANFMTQENL